jgi:hypothetical protein
MKKSRIIVGIQFVLLSALALRLLAQVRVDFLWSALGKWYRDTSRVADVDLPVVVRMLWPFAPVAWWSWITPFAIGVFVAARLRRPLNLSTLILSSLGTAFFVVLVVSVFLSYVRTLQYMGYPPVVPIDTPSMIANLSLVGLSVGFAGQAIMTRRAEQE